MPTHVINFAGGLSGPQVLVGPEVGTAQAPWGGPPGTWNALIDTGSTCTAISPAVRAALVPMKIGNARVARPGIGIGWEDTYFVRLKLGGHTGPGRWFNLEVVESQPSTPRVDVLIGMDLLVRINMTWEGPLGRLVLTY